MPDSASFSERIAALVGAIPRGKVATYGQIAGMAGSDRAARQVVRVLNLWSGKRRLPWHRVVNREGRISLPPADGGDEQAALLRAEGVQFGLDGSIDLERYGWRGPRTRVRRPR